LNVLDFNLDQSQVYVVNDALEVKAREFSMFVCRDRR
jgi:hypothetical protein